MSLFFSLNAHVNYFYSEFYILLVEMRCVDPCCVCSNGDLVFVWKQLYEAFVHCLLLANSKTLEIYPRC